MAVEIIDSEGKMVKRKDKKKVWRGGVLPDGYTTTTRKYAEIAEEWKPVLADIGIDNNQFTITRGDVTLVSTVIAETPVTLEVATNHQHEQLLQAKNNHHDYRMTTGVGCQRRRQMDCGDDRSTWCGSNCYT